MWSPNLVVERNTNHKHQLLCRQKCYYSLYKKQSNWKIRKLFEFSLQISLPIGLESSKSKYGDWLSTLSSKMSLFVISGSEAKEGLTMKWRGGRPQSGSALTHSFVGGWRLYHTRMEMSISRRTSMGQLYGNIDINRNIGQNGRNLWN